MEHDETKRPSSPADCNCIPRLTAKPSHDLLPKLLIPLGLGQISLPSEFETTVGHLVATWHDQEWPERVAALQILSRLSTQAPVHFVIQALMDENEHVRAAAARALGNMSDHAPTQPLVDALYDASWPVRAAAAQALGKIGSRSSIDALVDVMYNDEDESVRASVAQTLGRMGAQAPLQPLLLALQDKAWLVREAAASALGESGQSAPVEPLLAALHDPDASVRRAAQAALQEVYPEAVSATSTMGHPVERLEQSTPDAQISITPRPTKSEIITDVGEGSDSQSVHSRSRSVL